MSFFAEAEPFCDVIDLDGMEWFTRKLDHFILIVLPIGPENPKSETEHKNKNGIFLYRIIDANTGNVIQPTEILNVFNIQDFLKNIPSKKDELMKPLSKIQVDK